MALAAEQLSGAAEEARPRGTLGGGLVHPLASESPAQTQVLGTSFSSRR